MVKNKKKFNNDNFYLNRAFFNWMPIIWHFVSWSADLDDSQQILERLKCLWCFWDFWMMQIPCAICEPHLCFIIFHASVSLDNSFILIFIMYLLLLLLFVLLMAVVAFTYMRQRSLPAYYLRSVCGTFALNLAYDCYNIIDILVGRYNLWCCVWCTL